MGGRSLFFPSPYLFLFISFRPFSLACSPMITDNAHHDAVERRAEKGGEEWGVSLSATPPPPSLKSSPPTSSVCPSGKRIEGHFRSLLTKAAAPYCIASCFALKEVSRHFTLSRRPNGEWSRPCWGVTWRSWWQRGCGGGGPSGRWTRKAKSWKLDGGRGGGGEREIARHVSGLLCKVAEKSLAPRPPRSGIQSAAV